MALHTIKVTTANRTNDKLVAHFNSEYQARRYALRAGQRKDVISVESEASGVVVHKSAEKALKTLDFWS